MKDAAAISLLLVGVFGPVKPSYADGSVDLIVTDDAWRAAASAILSSGIYEGEMYDAQLERAGWSSPGHDDAAWAPVSRA